MTHRRAGAGSGEGGSISQKTPTPFTQPPPLLLLGHAGTAGAEVEAVAEVDARCRHGAVAAGNVSPAVPVRKLLERVLQHCSLFQAESGDVSELCRMGL